MSDQFVATTPRAYISGAISGLSPEIFRENFSRAEELVSKAGYDVVNPCKVVACQDQNCYEGKLDGAFPISGGGGTEGDFVHHWTCYMKYDIIEMLGCDTIIMLPNYLRSRGAQFELEVAKNCGLFVRLINDDYTRISMP